MPKYDAYYWESVFPDDTTVYGVEDKEARDNRSRINATNKEVGALDIQWKTDATTNEDFAEFQIKYDGLETNPTSVNKKTIFYGDPYSQGSDSLYVRIAKADDYDEDTQVRTELTGYVGVMYPDGETIKIDENGAISATKLNPGNALALNDPVDKFRLNVLTDSDMNSAAIDKSIKIGGDVTTPNKSYVYLNKDAKTIVYDKTNDNIKVNLDERTVIYDATKDYVRVSYDGFGKTEADDVTIVYDEDRKYLKNRTATISIWNDAETTVVTEGFNGVVHPDGTTIQMAKNADDKYNGRLYARKAIAPEWNDSETQIVKDGKTGIVIPDGKTVKINNDGYLTASSGDFHLKPATVLVPGEPGLYYVTASITTATGNTYTGTWILEFYISEDETVGYEKVTSINDPSVNLYRVLNNTVWSAWNHSYAVWFA